MRTLLFTIYDEKAEVFLPPFVVPTIGIATRAFSDCVNSDDHQFAAHPSHYTLFGLGEFFDHDATLVIIDKKSYGNGVEFLKPVHKDAPDGSPNPPILTDENG